MTEPTDKQLEDFAVEEQFLLFCDVDEFTQIARAVLAKWGTLRAEKIVIPTDTMEQEFQKHYQRGYAAGQKASATQPTQAQAIRGVQWQCGPQASGFTAPQADGQPAVAAKERKARESAQATGTDSSGAAQVDYSYAWRPIDDNTPRGTKLQLISRRDGVATYGHLGTDAGFWTHWAPLPTFRTEATPCGS